MNADILLSAVLKTLVAGLTAIVASVAICAILSIVGIL